MGLDMTFPAAWLNAKAANDPEGRTNREAMRRVCILPFPLYLVLTETLKIYLKRIAIQRRQGLIGSLSQMAAGVTHHCTPAKLRKIAESVPKIWILTGDEDNLIYPSNSFWLHKHMPEAEFEQWEDTGHGAISQHPERFNKRLDEVIQDAKQRIATGRAP